MLISMVKKTQLYFIFSFAAMILGGTMILKLPGIYTKGELSWLDALFTATSAVCVTGLTVVETGDFSLPGQVAVLLMLQLGGIGIMTLTASIMVVLGHKLTMGDTLMFATLSDRFTLRGTESLNRTVLNYTLIAEAVIIVLLFPGFMLEGYSIPQSLWYALFHSISSFCNGGMSPLVGNLVHVSAWVKTVVALSIILGGIGIYVVFDIRGALRTHQKLRAQTRLTVYATLFLVVGGTLLIWVLQRADDSPMTWIDSFFMSVTARTAGFNSVPMAELTGGSITVMILLMLVGAAPGSTGGGIKVTTATLAAAAVYNTLKGNRRVLISRREIPVENVLKAFSLIILYFLLVGFGAMVLQALTPCSLQWAFFEVVSALGTVGLALDGEPLTAGAKIFIVFYMFLGRVGLFTFFLFLLGREHKSRLTYPEERIIVG